MKKRPGFQTPFQKKRLKEDDGEGLFDDLEIKLDDEINETSAHSDKYQDLEDGCRFAVFFTKVSSKKHKSWEFGTIQHFKGVARLLDDEGEEIDRCFRNKISLGDKFDFSSSYLVEIDT